MPQFGKLKASVIVEGAALPEYYTTTAETTKAVTCWIPSQEGKAFSVRLENEAYPKALIASVTIDGLTVGGKVIHPRGISHTCEVTSHITSPTTCRELIFSRRELTDDDAFLNASVQGLGDIVLEIWDGIVGKRTSGNLTPYKAPENKIHERSKKALVHQVAFGQEKVIPAQTFTSSTKEKLLVIFTFKYRPIDILRADGIAPPDPAMNKRKADESDDDNDDDEGENENGNGVEDEDQDENDERELKKLLEQVSKMQDKMAKKNKAKPGKRMKKEPRPLFLPGEVIDLT